LRTAIYGSRPDGHAKVIVELGGEEGFLQIVGLLEDFPENAQRTFGNLTIIGSGDDLSALGTEAGVEAVLLGFGESRGRARAIDRIAAAGYATPSLVHRTAHVCASAEIGAGSQVLAFSYVGPDARIGRGVLLNTGAIVEHDCALDDGAVVAPGATLCGRVRVGTEALVGAGATVLPDVSLGAGSVVAAGALVREDVPPETVVAGVPARPKSSRP
jgi:sugar O-acyltransferase (sialic acid O-acetyltransferase NeuD family)